MKLNDATGETERVGGIHWTIKDGIIYDAKQMLAEVAKMVEIQKEAIKNGQKMPGPEEPASDDKRKQAEQKFPDPTQSEKSDK